MTRQNQNPRGKSRKRGIQDDGRKGRKSSKIVDLCRNPWIQAGFPESGHIWPRGCQIGRNGHFWGSRGLQKPGIWLKKHEFWQKSVEKCRKTVFLGTRKTKTGHEIGKKGQCPSGPPPVKNAQPHLKSGLQGGGPQKPGFCPQTGISRYWRQEAGDGQKCRKQD